MKTKFPVFFKSSLLVRGSMIAAAAFSSYVVHAQNAGDVIVSASSWLGGRGVDVHWNANNESGCWGSSYTTDPANGTSYYTGCEWQCGELAMRTYTARGWYPGNFNVDYAYQIYDQAGSLGMTTHANGSGYVPVQGDMVIWNSNCGGLGVAGHVAIVDYIDSGHVYVCEQNWNSNGRATLNRSGTNGSNLTRSDGVGCIRGVVHSPNNNPNLAPSVQMNTNGNLEVFAMQANGNLGHIYQPWGSWSAIGNWTGESVTTARNADGRLQAFVIGTDSSCNTVAQTVAAGGWGS